MEKCRMCIGELIIMGQHGDVVAGRCRACGFVNIFTIPEEDLNYDGWGEYGEADYYYD